MVCVDIEGSYKCQCGEGLKLSPNGHTCVGEYFVSVTSFHTHFTALVSTCPVKYKLQYCNFFFRACAEVCPGSFVGDTVRSYQLKLIIHVLL